MGPLTVAAVTESAPGEGRVALDPDAARRLVAAGNDVLIQAGAGRRAWFSDDAYTAAGARVVDAPTLIARSRSAARVLSSAQPARGTNVSTSSDTRKRSS